MQLHIRGQSSHVLECQGDEKIVEIKVRHFHRLCAGSGKVLMVFRFQARIAALEDVKSEDIVLFASGTPVADDSLVSSYESIALELNIPLLGGKVHGSLARAGTCVILVLIVFFCVAI